MQVFTDPASGRQYTVDPATGQSRWLDQPPPPAPTQQWAQPAPAPRKSRTGLKILGGVVGFFVVIGVLSSITSSGGDATTVGAAADSSPTASKAAQAVLTVTAAAFGDEFDANQPAAEQKYKGRRVKVTKAEISNITTGSITLKASSQEFSLTQISCDLSDESQALSAQNGQVISVTGEVDGQLMGVINLKACVVG